MSYSVLLLVCLFSVSPVSVSAVKAHKVCKPGVPLPYPTDSALKNCLIIGDSISGGYTPWVSENLSQICQVQHAPWDVRNGGALDTKYGMECLSIFLSTTLQEPTQYDAIVFNFGLHDIDYDDDNPVEYTPLNEYKENLELIKQKLLATGANIGFITSTPVPYSRVINDRVKTYNLAAEQVMRLTEPEIKVLDLYSWVVMVCGAPPYNACSIARKQPNPHYNPAGYKYLAGYVSALFRSLLNGEKKTHLSYIENLVAMPKHGDKVYCDPELNYKTACPPLSTCIKTEYSLSGHACCLLPNAVDCGDNRHCCPKGMSCDPGCNMINCTCSS